MKSFFHFQVVLLFGLLGSLSALGQFPVTLTVDSRSGDVVLSPPTQRNARYRITVEGTYSQWPGFPDCHGVDAVWVYDVPVQEVDALRWPPRTINGKPFTEIPHWVGDTTTYSFPPAALGQSPLFEISFRKNLGFRINGEPLQATQLDTVLHRYQHERAGTGEPFRFQILDSTYSIAENRVIPRYADNCGVLTVTIEEIKDVDVNICDVQPVVVNGQTVGIRVDAGIFESDSTRVDGRRNVLVSQDQIGIVDNGRFICPDSLVCDPQRTTPLSIGLVVDVSGSMVEDIEYNGKATTRIDALKATLHKFMQSLQPSDSLFLITFSTEVVLTHDWTTDTAAIGTAINSMRPDEYTALNQAIIDGLQKLSVTPGCGKVLITFTDGLNNRNPLDTMPVIEAIQSANIPLYIVAFGFQKTPDDSIGLQIMSDYVKAAPRGKLYEVHTGNELDAAYTEMASQFETEDCCKLYFKLLPCDKGQTKRVIRLVYPDGDIVLSKTITIDCDFKVSSVAADTRRELVTGYIPARPTPSFNTAEVDVLVPTPGEITAQIFDNNGKLIAEKHAAFADIGKTTVSFDTTSWATGLYHCRIWNGRSYTFTRVVVQH